MVARIRPGAIVLAPDGLLDRPRAAAALPLLLTALARRGYSVVTVTELLLRAAATSAPRRRRALGIMPGAGP